MAKTTETPQYVTDAFNTLEKARAAYDATKAQYQEALSVFRIFQRMGVTSDEMDARFPKQTRNRKAKDETDEVENS